MFAVKGARQRFGNRGTLGIIYNHANPGHGLNQHPMEANRGSQHQDDCQFCRADEHEDSLEAQHEASTHYCF